MDLLSQNGRSFFNLIEKDQCIKAETVNMPILQDFMCYF